MRKSFNGSATHSSGKLRLNAIANQASSCVAIPALQTALLHPAECRNLRQFPKLVFFNLSFVPRESYLCSKDLIGENAYKGAKMTEGYGEGLQPSCLPSASLLPPFCLPSAFVLVLIDGWRNGRFIG